MHEKTKTAHPDTPPIRNPNAEWHSQIQTRIRSLDALAAHFPGIEISDAMREAERMFPMAITPYYASLIRTPDFNDPIFRQCVPCGLELCTPDWLSTDPLNEETYSPAPCLVHRYPDRALVIATSTCSTYCRHCTRKRVSAQRDYSLSDADIETCVAYLSRTPTVSDLLISGGDPLMLPDDQIDRLLSRIRTVRSVKVIRIASRTPVTLPMRITPELVRVLAKHAPIFVNTHFNHPVELTEQSLCATDQLIDAGIPVGNQTVLLRSVNDSPTVIEDLCRTLFHHRIRPYYLFQCDLVRGIEHLRTPLQLGLDIMKYLRGHLSGMAIPNFAVDTPGQGGKVELLPQFIRGQTPTGTFLENSHGDIVFYPNPNHPETID